MPGEASVMPGEASVMLGKASATQLTFGAPGHGAKYRPFALLSANVGDIVIIGGV